MDHDIADGSNGYTIDKTRLINQLLGTLWDRDLGVDAAAEKDGNNNKKDTYLF
jgi:hypothetical protein